MTNAILLKVQTKEFWDALKENSIDLTVTKYPIDLNWEELEAIANTNGIDIIYYKDKNELKTSYHVPLDLDGKQNCLKSFLGCFHANNCVLLKQGRLYTCSIIANIIHFNEFFHKNLVVSENDSIDIYKVETNEELCSFLAKPTSFCRYCNVKWRTFEHPWGLSEKNITEWTIL